MNPSNLTSIIWSTDPVLTFSGQLTNTITTDNSWNSAAGNITVSVLALDQNGCFFAGQKIIKQCCGPKNGVLPNTEFFERSYYAHTSSSGLSSSIPSGVTYYAPTNVAINLPPPPVNSVSTPYSQPSTLTSLVNSGVVTLVGGVLSIPASFYINNDLIIDQSVILAPNNYVRIAPGRNIIINSGVTFSAANSTFAPKCNEMWGGFIVNSNGTTGANIKLDKCNVVGAVAGVAASNAGATFNIASCVFVDNLNGIVVTNNFSAGLNKVVNTYFGDVPNQPLLAPYNAELIPRTGIVLRNVWQMTIGTNQLFSSSIANTFGNLFHNMKIGIDGSRSTFQVYRNTFFKMTPEATQPAPNNGDAFCGVRATNSSYSIFPLILSVGATNTDFNIFHSCDFSISATNKVNLNARFNYMRNVRLRGISWEDNKGLTATIENNQINSENPNAWGIYVKNYPKGIANIVSNRINTNAPGSLITSPRFACGIYASTVTPTVLQTTNIELNTVSNCLYGIWLINISRATVKTNNVSMNYSVGILNQLSSIEPIRGIVVEDGSLNKVLANTITWLTITGGGNQVVNNNLQGIRIEDSPASEVKSNIMTKTAVGFYARGANIGSRVECNTMNNTNNGFYMDFADISSQGFAPNTGGYVNGYSAHNVWNSTYSTGTAGITINHVQNFLNYYHASGTQFNSSPTFSISSMPFNWKDITLTGTGSAAPRNGCVASILPLIGLQAEQIQKRTFEMKATVKDSLYSDASAQAMKHFLNQDVFKRLRFDSSLLNLNTVDDYLYQNYLDSMLNTEYYKIIKSQEAIANKEHDSARVYINQLDESDYFSDLIKKVESIWNESKANEIPISSSDSLYLYEIACLDPLKYGAGVYIARSILDYDGWCYTKDSKLKSIEDNDDIEGNQSLSIIPNPSNGTFEVVSSDEMEKIELIDMSGKLIKSINLQTNAQLLNFNIHSGIYILRVQFTNGNLKTAKIEIF